MDPLDIDIQLPRRAFTLGLALTVGAERVALVGPSGAGKTSLLRAVAGLERPTAGRIALGSERWFDAERRIDLRPERRRVGYLPQDYGLFPHLTVAGNVRFAGGRDRPDLLQRVGIEHLAGARPGGLSGGERQRVALARALAREPRVLLLDEPFAALDAVTREQLRSELALLLAELGLPGLVVTHSFEDATALAQRVGVVDRGRLVALAAPDELLARPATALVAALTGANVLDGIAVPGAGGCTIHLEGGGQITGPDRVTGPVQVAAQPWELSLDAPERSPIVDAVVSVRHLHGAVHVRLRRLTVQLDPAQADRAGPLHDGQIVGVVPAPGAARVFSAPGPPEEQERAGGR